MVKCQVLLTLLTPTETILWRGTTQNITWVFIYIHKFDTSSTMSLSVTSIPSSVDLTSLMSNIETQDDDSEFEDASGRNKITRCIITCFPEDSHPKWLLPITYFDDTTILEHWCGQFEICPKTENLHFHIYLKLKNGSRMRFTTLRELFNKFHKRVNITKPRQRYSKKSEQYCVNYVLAPDKRAPETQPYSWAHNKNKIEFNIESYENRESKEKQKVVLDQIAHIESKPKWWHWDQILHESIESKQLLATCSWGPKYHAGRHAEAPRRKIQDVIVLYGAGGTGKTTLASKWDTRVDEDFHERYYKRNSDDGKFWGGGKTAYRGQRIVHLEEFCGQEACSNFKEICDIGKFGPSVNIKNSGIDLNHDTVIITSNHHPAAWYRHLCSKEPKQWHPIARRFTQVWFFPDKRPDGSDNIPSESEPPYYIDQTDEFALFNRSYENAVSHASEHWPLPIPSDENTDGVSHANTFVPTFEVKENASNPFRIRGGGDNDVELESLEELIFELIGPFNVWPSTIATIFKNRTLTHKSRFTLSVFLLNNGLDPDLLIEWFKLKHKPNGKQLAHVKQIIKEFPSSKWTSYNMIKGQEA